MARKKEPEVKKGLDEWMATYSDMVTLLLCFFVLLYASSSPNATKWQYIMQAFQSNGTYVNTVVKEEEPNADVLLTDDEGNSLIPTESTGEENSDVNQQTGTLPKTFDGMTEWLQSVITQNDMSAFMSVEGTSSRIYIRFDNSIMFEGDSAELLESGKKALKLLFPGIKAIDEYIKSIIVSGHTADGISNINGWDLSAARACSCIKYMDFSLVTASEKFKAEGHSQYEPLSTNDTEEGRAKNRRVELIIVRNNVAVEDDNIIMDVLKYDYNMGNVITDPDDRTSIVDGTDVSAVEEIIDDINRRYSENGNEVTEDKLEYVGPVLGFSVETITDDMLTAGEAADGEAAAAADTADTAAADTTA